MTDRCAIASVHISAPLPDSIEQSLSVLLRDYPGTPSSRPPRVSGEQISRISELLARAGKLSWSRIPRVYSVLRMIDRAQDIDIFIDEGITDLSFPFTISTLPIGFRNVSDQHAFVELQNLVLTKALDLEKEDGKHRHFSKSDDVPLKKLEELGKGAYGSVDRVLSTITHHEYARKLIRRGRTLRKDTAALRDFEAELKHLKKLRHEHIVRFVGSYTDSRFVAILMSPVADTNLREFLDRDSHSLRSAERSLLRTFYGCLAVAVQYLHDKQVRHKDIKPQNILVKDHQVFLADFGIALDWSDNGYSTTTGPSGSRTERYCAPEVGNHLPRNTLADLWSLGCVYLEIWTVMKGETIQNLMQHLENSGTRSVCYYQNRYATETWCDGIEKRGATSYENIPLNWIRRTLQYDQDGRWTARQLVTNLIEANDAHDNPVLFIGNCCSHQDDGSSDEDVSSQGSFVCLKDEETSSGEVHVPWEESSKRVHQHSSTRDPSSNGAGLEPMISEIQAVQAPDPRTIREQNAVIEKNTPHIPANDNRTFSYENDIVEDRATRREKPSNYVNEPPESTVPFDSTSHDDSQECIKVIDRTTVPIVDSDASAGQLHSIPASSEPSSSHIVYEETGQTGPWAATGVKEGHGKMSTIEVPERATDKMTSTKEQSHRASAQMLPEQTDKRNDQGQDVSTRNQSSSAASCVTDSGLAREDNTSLGKFGKSLGFKCGNSEIRTISFSPNGQSIITGSNNGKIRLLDLTLKKVHFTVDSHAGSVASVAFSPDGKMTAWSSWGCGIKLWDAKTMRFSPMLMGHASFVSSIAFSLDGKLLVSGSWDRTIRIWNVARGQILFTLQGHSSIVASVAFSPDGKLVVSGSQDKTVRLWDVETQRMLFTLRGHLSAVRTVAFSPDGKLLASGSMDSAIRLWDVATQEARFILREGPLVVTSIAFSADGKLIAAGSGNIVRLWDVGTGQIQTELTGHSGGVRAVTFSSDGQLIASGCSDATIRIWKAMSEQDIASKQVEQQRDDVAV